MAVQVWQTLCPAGPQNARVSAEEQFPLFHLEGNCANGSKRLQKWITKWQVSAEMLQEAAVLANQTSPSCPSAVNQPHTWRWFCPHIFSTPVNNVMAERQFNISQLYINTNESELSKQASHLFVENIIHRSASLSSGKMTASKMRLIAQHMRQYAATITPARLKSARHQLKLLRSGQSNARTQTAAEVYSSSLRRHRRRPNIEKEIEELEQQVAIAPSPSLRRRSRTNNQPWHWPQLDRDQRKPSMVRLFSLSKPSCSLLSTSNI